MLGRAKKYHMKFDGLLPKVEVVSIAMNLPSINSLNRLCTVTQFVGHIGLVTAFLEVVS